jgi:dipeptidyl aminopeptidase/acylaminoacyl peptidase
LRENTVKKTLYIALTMILCALLAVTGSAQVRRPMTPADILRIATVSDAQISPNAQWVVYTVSTIEKERTISTLWLARAAVDLAPNPTSRSAPATRQPLQPSEGSEVRYPPTPLLPAGWTAATPRWSPDSMTIAFLANHEGLNGIWVTNIGRREPTFMAAVQSTNFFITYAGESFAWSPDSKRIAYISATEEFEGAVKKSDDPSVINRIQYKSRTSLSDNRRTHVWIVGVDKPEPRQLTSGPFYDHAITFSPSGDEIAFLSNHESDPDANNNSDIFAVDLGGQVRQITQTKGCEYEPTWSPDGRWIAYTATKRDVTTIDSVAEDSHIWVISAAGGAGRELTAEQDRRARSPRWERNSRTIFFLAADNGYTTIFGVDIDDGKVGRLSLFVLERELGGIFDIQNSKFRVGPGSPVTLARPFQITNFSFGNRSLTAARPDEVTINYMMPLAFTMGTAMRPAEVWFGLGNSTSFRRLSAHNDGFNRSQRLTEPEEITFKSFDGTPIQGWLMKPIGFSQDRRYPLILSIHGGPHGMYGSAFNPTFQVYAARGYAILYLNPRGSSGYGQKFSDGTLNEWGGGDYKDLMAGVDEALRKYSWIDRNRLGVTGGSYGGFMTNWIITQTPRFKAAVASASVSNLISFYSTSLYQDLVHAEFGGFPWDNYDLLWQWSPLRYVRQAQTPTLFIHGEQDNDVHITQAEEMYMALKRRGVETVFVRYPREGHGLREPRHRVDALERTIAWFDRFLK